MLSREDFPKNTVSNGSTHRHLRGRPRKYNESVAIRRALRSFWLKGYSATSLADLSSVTKMSRSSLNAAFGDKEAIYSLSLQRFRDEVRGVLSTFSQSNRPI